MIIKKSVHYYNNIILLCLLQIVNAPNKSHKARLVSCADKLYNLRDLNETTPLGWSNERVHEYFEWSAKVVRGMLGANKQLETKLKEVLATRSVSLLSDDPAK